MQLKAQQLETSSMERQGILVLESSGMESTHYGIFIRDDAMGLHGDRNTHTVILYSHLRLRVEQKHKYPRDRITMHEVIFKWKLSQYLFSSRNTARYPFNAIIQRGFCAD